MNTFVAELSAWNEADEDKDKEESVTLSTITEPNTYYENLKSSFRATLNTTFETTKFTEDDADDELVVIYTAAMNDDDGKYDIKSVDVAKSVTAFITATSGETSFTAGGETYKYSAVHSGQAAYNKDADDAVFYLDSYGYVVYIDMDAAESTDYAYVEAVESDRGMFEEEVYYAKMVLANGETVIAPVDKAYTWDDGEDAYKEYTISSDDDAVMSNSIVSYTVNKDGEYKLYVQTSGADLVDDGNLAITKGNAAIKDSTTITNANDKTVFIVGETDGSKVEYEVYTGIRNVPSISGGDYTFYENAAGAAKVVVVIDPTNTSSSSSESIYVAYDDAADKIINADYEDGYYELNAVVNGEITTVKLDVATYEAMTEDVYVKSVSTDRDGLIDGFGSDVKTAEGKSAKIEDGMVKVGNDYYTVADDCNVYTVEDAEITSSSLNSVKTNSDIVVSFNDDDMVNVIYIIIAD